MNEQIINFFESKEGKEFLVNYLKENLFINIDTHRFYGSDDVELTIKIQFEDQKICSDTKSIL